MVIAFSLSTASFAFDKTLVNRIEGRVYDPSKNAVLNANVELLNDVNALIAYTKSDSGGRFVFTGVSSGRFIIKVSAYQLNLKEQTQEVEVIPARNNSSDIVYVDIHLRYDKPANKTNDNQQTDAIFIQDVPKSAKELYENGSSLIEKNPSQAITLLEDALKVFPTYFDALSLLGKQFLKTKDYDTAEKYLLRAVEVNPRSVTNFYSLAFSYMEMKQLPKALEAAKMTVSINSSIANSNLLYGTILRLSNNYAEAEKILVKAKSLNKKPIPEIYWQLALVYNRLNRNSDAANELENYLKADPQNPNKDNVKAMIEKLRASVK